jgi:hypothetical protein
MKFRSTGIYTVLMLLACTGALARRAALFAIYDFSLLPGPLLEA